MNKFLEAIHDMIEIITGERPESPTDKDWETVRDGDRGTSDRKSKPKRARGLKGRYKGDDLSMPKNKKSVGFRMTEDKEDTQNDYWDIYPTYIYIPDGYWTISPSADEFDKKETKKKK